MLHGTVLQHNYVRPHAARNTSQFLGNNVQISPQAFHVVRLKPKQTRLEQIGETCLRQGEHPANVHELFQALKQEWVAILAQVIHNLIQSMPKRCWVVIDSRGEHPPTDVGVTQWHNTEWWNFFLDEKSVKIINFDLNQLQNEIWCTRFLVEFSNNISEANQIRVSFFEQCTLTQCWNAW